MRRACRAAAVAMVLAACAGPRPAPEDPLAGRPLRTLSPDALIQDLDAEAAAIRAVKARGAIDFAASSDARHRSCRAVLAARSASPGEPPAGLYVKGSHTLVPTLFTLVSDGERFWLHVPRDNVVYTGPFALHRADPDRGRVLLDARDLLRSLFVGRLSSSVTVEEEPRTYVVSETAEGTIRRRLWVDRRGLTVDREVYFDAAGAEELVVERSRYRDLGGHLYPARIRLRDPRGGAEVQLDLDSVTMNPADLTPDAFKPIAPAGARVEVVSGRSEGGT